MKRPWFYRMLLSYLPIFFFISSFLFFIFFQELGAQSKRDAVKANQVLNLLAKDKVENSLNGIDYALVDFSLNNKVVNQFFQAKSSNVVLNKDMLKEIDTFKRQNPLVDSMYLVRSRDGIVLTERYMFREDEFSEQPYIRAVEQTTGPVKWTSPHDYQEFAQSTPRKVVTLARSHFTPVGDRCLIVANVKIESLRSLVETTYSPDVSFVWVTGSDGADVLGNGAEMDRDRILSESRSGYLNWTFHSGLVNDAFTVASQVSSAWISLGVITVVLGLLAIVYVTRRNYRPLENVVSHIRSLVTDRQEQAGTAGTNEFVLIESAIEDLMKRSTITEKRREEEISLRKKHFLYEVIEGVRNVSVDEWTAEMAKYNLPSAMKGAQVLAVEIDNEAAFSRDFSQRDQFLLKYAIHNSASEIFHQYALPSWSEWISGRRLICIILRSEQTDEEETRVACDEFLFWVTGHLPLTVTVGMGSLVARHDQISVSYQEALQALRSKFFKGLGKVIPHSETSFGQGAELFAYLAPIRSLAREFRTGSPGWSDTFKQLFAGFRSDLLSADDILSLLDYLIFQLDRTIGELSPDYQSPWKEKGMSALTDVLDTSETLEDIQLRMFTILFEIGGMIGSAHETSQHHQLLLEVKGYIEANFSDPDMSLDRLRDQFGLNPKYLSQLFKEKFGEGFMDFLIRLRIDHAKEWLASTSEPIQSIAGKAGYLNVISFTRAFKKVTSLSPGDYRKSCRGNKQSFRGGTGL